MEADDADTAAVSSPVEHPKNFLKSASHPTVITADGDPDLLRKSRSAVVSSLPASPGGSPKSGHAGGGGHTIDTRADTHDVFLS